MAVDFDRSVHCILGLPFDIIEMDEVVRRVRDAATSRIPCFVSTPNINWLIGCRADGRFRASVVNSDLSVADGMPLLWIARLLGIPLPGRVAGSDLFDRLKEGIAGALRVFFFGGAQGVAETACRRLNEERCGLVCAGFEYPGFGSVDEMSGEDILERINRSRADLVVVSLGARKGQEWIVRNRGKLSAPVICHLGAVVNFAAGTLRRSPIWMRRAGLEWLWRVKTEPALWRRYLRDALALLALFLTRSLPFAWYLRRGKPDADELAAAGLTTHEEGGLVTVRLSGAWTQQNLGPLRRCLSSTIQAGRGVHLDMAGVTYADSALMGILQLLQGHQAAAGRRFLIEASSPAMRRVMRYCCAEYLMADPGG